LSNLDLTNLDSYNLWPAVPEKIYELRLQTLAHVIDGEAGGGSQVEFPAADNKVSVLCASPKEGKGTIDELIRFITGVSAGVRLKQCRSMLGEAALHTLEPLSRRDCRVPT
jgi:hypothetical protein